MSGDIENKQPSILGLCNPLLDISAYVEQDILNKFKLQPNNVILANDEHKDLCKELVEKYPVEYTAGGSAQNVMRVLAGILRRQNVKSKVMFTGCISDDEFGSLMSKKASEDGVIVNYSICKSVATGTCAVCLTENGKNRSLCAFLGASQYFRDHHLRENWQDLVENTDIIYISGFLVAVSPESFHLLGKHVADSGVNSKKVFCLNLSAPYVSDVFGAEIDKIMKYVDILFGNDDEAIAFAKFKKWETKDPLEIAARICRLEKARPDVNRIVIITQGERPIILVKGTSAPKIYPCERIPDEEIVDTNGAGDSFAGGFLSQYLQGRDLDFCVEMGNYAAREIIKVSGIAVPEFEDIPTSNIRMMCSEIH